MTFRSPSLFCALALTGALSACGAPGAGSAPPAAESSEPGTSTPGSGEAPDDDANFPDTAPDAPSDPSDNPNSSAPGANPNIPASVHLVGRFDTNNPAGPRFTWPNSTVVVTFKGTGLRAKLAAMVPGSTTRMSDYYDVWVDGQGPRPLNLTAGATEYILCDGLANGTHTVRLIKRTESRYSTGQLLGVETEPPG
ncbi:MAG TPA: hypothetical protein VFH51_08770, partial [Myxococcota bacterium]|nr:hypothetical protein [Myxococcota bacterium]